MSMRWANSGRLPDIKRVIDRFQLYDRILQRNTALIQGYGTPCTSYRNTSINEIGVSPDPDTSIKCYCWSTPVAGGGSTYTQEMQPDRFHFLCSGTGWLEVNNSVGGYQKFGYKEHIFSTPSKLTRSTKDLVISGKRNDSYNLSGSSLSGTLDTDMITLSNFKDIDYILISDFSEDFANRLKYYYTVDNTNWVELNTISFTSSIVANKEATLSLPVGSTQIKFRILLEKRNATATSPKWNSIKFRYRHSYKLSELDDRFSDIEIPAFLASREQTSTYVEGSTEHGGWITRFPTKFKTLPNTNIENADIIKFLKGTYSDFTFQTSDVLKATYGESSQILHRSFEAVLVRDGHDFLKIAHYLL